jgi:nicotinamide riboside kinase
MIKGITRIAISGVESTGKTTLALALSKALDAEVAFEAARTDPRVRAGTIERPDLKRLANAQWQACMAAEDRASKSQSSAVISDTDSTVIRMWGRWVFDAEIPGLEGLEQWADITLICAPNIPWVADPLRSLPDLSDRQNLHQRYLDELQNRADHPWVLIDGLTHEKRLEQSVRAVQFFRNDSSVSE